MSRVLALALFLPWLLPSVARAAAPTEYEVKSAFLLNFARFVEWPTNVFSNASAPLIIGVVGAKEILDVLPRMTAQQTVRGRRFEIRELQPTDTGEDCQVLFIGRVAGTDGEALLRSLRGRPVLTVGETEDFNENGGVIRFLIVNKNVRFDVHTKAAAKAGLKISSKLLSVARTVIASP